MGGKALSQAPALCHKHAPISTERCAAGQASRQRQRAQGHLAEVRTAPGCLWAAPWGPSSGKSAGLCPTSKKQRHVLMKGLSTN